MATEHPQSISSAWPFGLRPFPAIALLAGAILFSMVVWSPSYLIYDEGYYQPGAMLLVDGHGFRALFDAPFAIPTGPLYAVIHAIASPLTGFGVPAIRLVNIALLAGAWALTAYTIRQMRLDRPWSRAAAIVGAPMIWVVAGMALTEVPALFFSCAACAFLAWGVTRPEDGGAKRLFAGFVLSGLCLGAAILGRQLILPAIVAYVLIGAFHRSLLLPALAGLAATGAVVLPIFMMWGGIVPPGPAGETVSASLSIPHGIMALCYLGVVLLILAPSYYFAHWKWTLAAGLAGGLAGFAIGDLGISVASGLMGRLPGLLQPLAERGAAGTLLGAGAALGVATALNLWERREDHVFVLSVCLMGGLALTAAGVAHQFSSRYLVSAFPFVILAIQPYFRPGWPAAGRIALGAALGAMLLANYYSWPDLWTTCTLDGYRAHCPASSGGDALE